MYEFKLPDIGEGLAEAEILEWSVTPGDDVAEGDVVAVVSTDKVNVELSAPCSGTISEFCAEVGDIVKVGTVFMRIDNGSSAEPDGPGDAANKDQQDSPASESGTGEVKQTGAKVRASPAVRRLARERGIDLQTVVGSGRDGMILAEDLEAMAATAPDTADQSDITIETLSGSKLAAAKNLAKSSNTLATSTITFEVLADPIVRTVEALRPDAERAGVKLTPLALIAKCLALALEKHPRLNANVGDNEFELLISHRVNLGVAVAANGDLVVPVIEDLGQLSLFEIAGAVVKVAERGRGGKLDVTEMRGSSFTLSNTGGLEGVLTTSTTPVINFPNVAMLWISRISDRPWVLNGELAVCQAMSCTLAFDHRYLHGAECLEFINDFNELLQHPETVAGN